MCCCSLFAFDVYCSSLLVVCWLLLFVVCYMFLCCWSIVDRCSLLVAFDCCFFGVRCSLFVVRRALFVVLCLLFGVCCCLVFADVRCRCSSFVVFRYLVLGCGYCVSFC